MMGGTWFPRACLLALVALAPVGASAAEVARPLPRVRVAPDGRSFVTADGKPFVPLGVNYYRPGTGWAPQVWKQFDPEGIRRDFARLRELGANTVRVFLSYGSFFPEPDSLRPEGLDKLDRFLALAEEAGLYVHPTGPDHWEGRPAWASDAIADPKHLAALETFWKALATRYRGRGVIFAYDLLNEPAVPWDSPALRIAWNEWLREHYPSTEAAARAWGADPATLRWGEVPAPEPKDAPGDRRLLDYQHCRESVARRWTRRQAEAIKAADPAALVTVGLVQWSIPALLPGVRHYAAFRPRDLAGHLDFLEVHFYPLESGFYAYTGDEAETRNLAYLEAVVRETAAPGKPVVLAEFGWYGGGKLTIDGGRHPEATGEQQARWCRRAVETTRGLATGWLNWGFHDHPQARDVSQLTGLLTADGTAKPWAREFRRLSADLSSGVGPAKLGPRPDLDWDAAVTSARAGHAFRADYLAAYLRDRRLPPAP